ECPAGQRCRAGSCVDACDGVVCPDGQDCRAGRCLDLCADLSCDPECSVCDGGECVARCNLPGNACAAGELCGSDGTCVPTECSGVSCEPGSTCRAGRGCVDACEGAVCPTGETCMMGACVSNMSVMPGGDDAGMETDGEDAGLVEPDAGPIDGGRIPTRRGDGGCSCAAAGVPSETPVAPMALGALGLGFVMARRRRRR
ncbi:MAG: MYXO-CTERM sorting domain-containing protein, partial [Phycisphaerales bacterium]|nr:MYXO-CTERM sorting domain-containing protein [Phycisphaerales bacterium]